MRKITQLWSMNLTSAIFALAIVLYVAGCGKPADSGNSDSTAPSIAGQKIEFKQGAASEQYCVSGWSKAEEKFTWSEGTSSKLGLPVGTDRGPWVLKVTMAGLVHPPDLPAQPVQVYANDEKVAEWNVGNTEEFTATIPASVNKPGGKLQIEFRIPKATTPKSLGENQDTRVLGICLYSLELNKA
jgi:hypothetical protein